MFIFFSKIPNFSKKIEFNFMFYFKINIMKTIHDSYFDLCKKHVVEKDRDIVLSKSNEYRSSQDYLSGYIQERIEITEDELNYVTWSEIQEDSKDWFTELYGNKLPKGQE